MVGKTFSLFFYLKKPKTYTTGRIPVYLRITVAGIYNKAALEDLHYNADRNIDKNQMMRFADCSFIDKAECILITGSTGIGKSYIASALGHHACSMGYKAVYYNVPKLFTKLKMSKADGSYLKEVAKIERQHLLILDDFGLQPFDAQSRVALMELIEDRHGKGALIITSQLPVNKWYDIILYKPSYNRFSGSSIYLSKLSEICPSK